MTKYETPSIYVYIWRIVLFLHVHPVVAIHIMPIDQKRINGPEASVPYDIYIHSELKDKGIQFNSPKRHDGRSNDELRNICKVM